MNFFKSTLIVLLLMASQVGHADVCSWNDKSVAMRARAFVAYYPGDIYTYCKNCGDNSLKSIVIGEDFLAENSTEDRRAIHFRQRESGDKVYWQFVINGEYKDQGIAREIDLAYTYVREPKFGGYINLGARFSCVDPSDWGSPERSSSMVLKDLIDQPLWIMPEQIGNGPNQIKLGVDVSEEDYFKALEKRHPDQPLG